MKQNLELTQKQILSQHMIQSMEILQMSATELENYLENLSMENPVVELSENRQTETDAKALEMARKMEWLSSTDRQNRYAKCQSACYYHSTNKILRRVQISK